MKFQFEGKDYRIGFQHDPPREWAAHYSHEIGFVRATRPDGGFHGPAILHCLTCSTKRKRPVKLSHFTKGEKERSVSCTIYELVNEEAVRWKPLYSGKAKVNVKAGDRYSKEEGRRAALQAALNSNREAITALWGNHMVIATSLCYARKFSSAAWTAYLTRKQVSRADQGTA